MLITGHFDPIVGKDLIREELTRLRQAVLYVHDETVKGMNDGKDVYTLMREIRLPENLEVGEGYGKVAWAVRAIWEGYGGWFQFRSATELYEVPASKVYPEMVELAGGADVVAGRARARVEAGEPLEGLHLAEMALAAEPGNASALRAQLAALELLLKRSGRENFWEVGWLRHQIAATTKALSNVPPPYDSLLAKRGNRPLPEVGS
jgi:alkyl sulfatase BDS1-like metallo-beta-lactamase superfamily hydrolase